MPEYRINEPGSVGDESSTGHEDPKYWAAFFAGLGVSIVVAIILAAITIWLESEYDLIVILGLLVASWPIRHFVPRYSLFGAVMGAVVSSNLFYLSNNSKLVRI